MKASQVRAYQETAIAALETWGFPAVVEQIEIVDFGLGRFEKEGLAMLVLVNYPMTYCGKLLLMRPWQLCPTHRHPPIPECGNYQGKQETFICLRGVTRVAFEGQVGRLGYCRPVNAESDEYYPALGASDLGAGDRITIPRDTWHWFEAGPSGALILEISTPSYDGYDIFMDPEITRCPEVDRD